MGGTGTALIAAVKCVCVWGRERGRGECGCRSGCDCVWVCGCKSVGEEGSVSVGQP